MTNQTEFLQTDTENKPMSASVTLKNPKVIIPADNPFANCKLGREAYAEVLTNIVENYAEGFVLALNSEWGSGKTTFVEMWQKHLELQDFKTIYFNAWENDLESDPLIALISEMKSIAGDSNNDKFKKVIKNAAPLTKTVIKGLAKGVIERYAGDGFVGDLAMAATDQSIKIFEKKVELYTKQKKGIKEFHDSLVDFVKSENAENKPIVFFIDEMDRCRPDYAVELLEKIKHLFDIPGIVFVLSIDKEQLKHAICGVYGSGEINSEEYLRRFIDVEYSLPEPDKEKYIDFLFEFYRFEELVRPFIHFQADDREIINLKKTASILFSKENVILRQQEKIIARTRLIINSYNRKERIFPEFLLFMIYIKTFQPELYISIKFKILPRREVQTKIDDLLSEFLSLDSQITLLNIEAQFLFFYGKNFQERDSIYLWFKKEEKILNFESNLEISTLNNYVGYEKSTELIRRRLFDLHNTYDTIPINVDYYINKIELYEKLEIAK